MKDKKKKQTYFERNGERRVGAALRWMAKLGKKVAPELLDAAGAITGIPGLNALSNLIKGDKNLTESDKELLLAELEADRIEMQEITKRWEADMNSDSWMSKNVRPLALKFLTVSLISLIIIDSSISGFLVQEDWITLLSSLLLLVYGAYFGGRSLEKIQNIRNKD